MIVSIKPAYLDRDQAAAYVSLSNTTMDDLIKAGAFPKPRQLSPKRVGWKVSELETWCDSRPVSDMPPPPPRKTGRQDNAGRRSVTARQQGAPNAQPAA